MALPVRISRDSGVMSMKLNNEPGSYSYRIRALVSGNSRLPRGGEYTPYSNVEVVTVTQGESRSIESGFVVLKSLRPLMCLSRSRALSSL